MVRFPPAPSARPLGGAVARGARHPVRGELDHAWHAGAAAERGREEASSTSPWRPQGSRAAGAAARARRGAETARHRPEHWAVRLAAALLVAPAAAGLEAEGALHRLLPMPEAPVVGSICLDDRVVMMAEG
mmetsp:Transcript_95827/g.253155  ORF Transcript_95827/g.253155 Transcript_95827/m.253155 type:complete len:131 (+) Transcript_95827:110-502(+)